MIRQLFRRARPPWRRPRRLVILLAALVVFSGAAGAWLLLRDGTPAAAASTTATAATQTLKETVTASGTVAARTTADLSFAVSGTVTAVYVEPGDKVRKGQKLAAVDNTVLEAELAAAQSSLDAAETARSEHLSDGSSDEQVAADQAAVVSAESSLTQAEAAVEDAVLRSTTTGTVTAVGIEVDDTVGSSAMGGGAGTSTDATGTNTGTITVISTGRFVVDATVASGDVEKVIKGLQTEVSVSGIDETIYGTVLEVGLVAETDANGAAAFPVTIAITDKRDDLFAGTSADISVVVSQRAGVLTVDSRAVQNDGDKTYVDKVTDAATGDSTRTEIEIGETSGMATEVVSGLTAGDVVVVPGFAGPGGGGGDQEMQEMQQQMRERMEQGGQMPDMPPGGFIQPGGPQ